MNKAIPYPLRGAWLITDEGRDLVMGVWETAQSTGKAERIALALEARDGEPFKKSAKCFVTDAGVAVLDIDGPLMRKAELFSDVSGATSYQWIGATVEALRVDPSVRAVLIRANSPGGEAAGVGECAEKIARLAAEKTVECYIETQAASACYWLASQCSRITAHPTAQAGWIGAIRDMLDTSKRDATDGVKRIQIVSKGAEEKRTYPIDKAQIDRVQRMTDEWGALFTDAVASGRGVTAQEVLEKFGGGFGMFSAEALDVGLIDAIGDFETVLARLSAGASDVASYAARQPNGVNRMAKPSETHAADADNEWKCTGCKEMMGPSATKYCAKCAADDEPDDEDDEDDDDEAKALGLDAKASRGARLARAMALVDLESKVLAAVGATTHEAAIASLVANAKAGAELAASRVEAQRSTLRAALERGIAGANGEAPRLSLGMIQKTIATVLRGETRKAYLAAVDQVLAAADEAKATVTAKALIDAVCAVKLSAEDVEAITDFIAAAPPVAASTFAEPYRDGTREGAELDEGARKVAAAAEQARRTLDKNRNAAK